MKLKLRTKLSVSYLLIGLLCILAISIFSNIFLEKSFIKYVIKNQDVKNKALVEQIASQFDESGQWDYLSIESLGITALEQGIILRVEDENGAEIWDATVHNSGMCEAMIEHMAASMMENVPDWQGEYVENNYEVSKAGGRVGNVVIGFYGPYYYTESDGAFIKTLNRLLLVVSLMAIVLSLVIGAIMARRISQPLSKVMETAGRISKGNFEARSVEHSTTIEIHALIQSINELAETLENQEKLRQRLTSDVAHELRTPLATLQSHMEAMIDGIWVADAARLTSCHDEIVRISSLVGDLEKLAKFEREMSTGERNPVDFKQLVINQVKNFETDFYKKSIIIALEIPDNDQISYEIMADKNQMNQVVVNILSNAYKYTCENSEIIVRLAATTSDIVFEVQDFGIGIAETDLPFIFERFYRAEQSRNRMSGGAGIGLTITQAIVKAHGGTIDVVSELGKGSTFKVRVPKG